MAVRNVTKIASSVGIGLDDRDFLSTDLQTADDRTYNPHPTLAGGGDTATFLRGFPYTVPHIQHPYSVVGAHGLFYQGLHFLQDAYIKDGSSIDLGAISQDTSLFFGVFNTHGVQRVVDDVYITSATSGLTVANLAPADLFGPYEEVVVQIDASEAGDAVVNTNFCIKFTDDPVTYCIPLTAVRYAKFFTSDPNWVDGVTVGRAFLTSIHRSTAGSETRKVLRAKPVRTLEATLFFAGKHAAGQYWETLRESSSSVSVYPWYPDKSTVSGSSEIRRIYCSTEYRRFASGDYAFLSKGFKPDEFGESEVVRVDEVFADGFSTVSDIQGSYATGDCTYPAFAGRPRISGQPIAPETDSIGTVGIEISEVYGEVTLGNENEGYVPTTFNDLPIIEGEITWSELPSQNVMTLGESSPSGNGFVDVTSGRPIVTQEVTVLCRDKQQVWEQEGFFNYLKGRGRSFWSVSVLDFLDIVSTAGTTSFNVANPNSGWEWLEYVKVTDSAGAFEIIEVASSSTSAGITTINLASNGLSDIRKAVQAYKARLSTDLVTEEYLTDGVMLCTFEAYELQGA